MLSRTRQSSSVRAVALDYPRGGRIPAHTHAWDQLVYATSGVLKVTADEGSWIVPPQRAVWIPDEQVHRLTAPGPLQLRTVYLPAREARLPRRCCVVAVSPLLRELIVYLAVHGPQSIDADRLGHLVALLLDLSKELQQEPLSLPSPEDPRACRVAELLRRDPGDERSLEQLAVAAGASLRTVQRLFVRETGMTLRAWRQQARLQSALILLAAGERVTTVAHRLGYDSVSAFGAMFRRALGKSPGSYF